MQFSHTDEQKAFTKIYDEEARIEDQWLDCILNYAFSNYTASNTISSSFYSTLLSMHDEKLKRQKLSLLLLLLPPLSNNKIPFLC